MQHRSTEVTARFGPICGDDAASGFAGSSRAICVIWDHGDWGGGAAEGVHNDQQLHTGDRSPERRCWIQEDITTANRFLDLGITLPSAKRLITLGHPESAGRRRFPGQSDWMFQTEQPQRWWWLSAWLPCSASETAHGGGMTHGLVRVRKPVAVRTAKKWQSRGGTYSLASARATLSWSCWL